MLSATAILPLGTGPTIQFGYLTESNRAITKGDAEKHRDVQSSRGPNDEAVTTVREGTEYIIRPYERGDAAGFRSLYETIHGIDHGGEWFHWRFVQNPYLDHVPMFVTTAAGDVVGVRPFFAFRMTVDGRETTALLTVDTMVHPAHRGRGLFTTMTERAVQYYRTGAPAFVFNQPNLVSLGGYTDLGWQQLGRVTKYYRVQRPGSVLHASSDSPVTGLLCPLVDTVGKYGLRAVDSVTGGQQPVETKPGVEASFLASLAGRNRPDGVSAVRDDAYYQWRFGGPAWHRRTYWTTIDGTTVGALARTRTNSDGITVTQIADVVPLTGGKIWQRGVQALLAKVIADHRDSDLLSAIPSGTPTRILHACGFLPDDRPPLSVRAGSVATLCVRSLTDGDDWQVGPDGTLPTDPAKYHLLYGDRDTV